MIALFLCAFSFARYILCVLVYFILVFRAGHMCSACVLAEGISLFGSRERGGDF
jgi:hypothetical protein